MAQLNDWLSIDKISGTGNAEITLTASSYEELVDRTTSLKIQGISKNAILTVRQNAFVPPSTNAYFWVNLEEDGEIYGIVNNTIEYSFNQSTWNSFPISSRLSVPANTYVWFYRLYIFRENRCKPVFKLLYIFHNFSICFILKIKYEFTFIKSEYMRSAHHQFM